jgi:uncharacterized protein (DUF342 family)
MVKQKITDNENGDLYMEPIPGQGQENTNRQTVLFGNPNDGNLSLWFSDADLELHADFIPPAGDGKALDAGGIVEILEKIKVIHGLLWEVIREALDDCNLGRRLVKDVIIARGDPPVNEVTEYFEMNPALVKNKQLPKGNSRINYHNYSPFVIVKKNQVLAKLRPRKPGQEGKNVHGDALPFSTISPEGVSGAGNTRLEGGFILSNIDGQLVTDKKTLLVQETLLIKGGVDYNTGNIVFPGDVMIEGPVSDGFKIYSGGSITIKQTFDVTEAVTRGDLNVAGGIIGRGAGLLKAGGEIKTKFIENCKAAARKTIKVDSEIINSSVFTLEQIIMGDKGLILGCDVWAVHGIRAAGIGRKAGKATRIHCGVDFVKQQEKEKGNNRLRILAAKLAKLRELMEDPNPDEERRAKLEELRLRLEEEQQAAGSKVSDLLGEINSDENAVVEVSGEVMPGTLIEICQIALFVDEPLRKVRVRLDKAGGKLVAEGLS